jgi:GTPase SAR1 family protein
MWNTNNADIIVILKLVTESVFFSIGGGAGGNQRVKLVVVGDGAVGKCFKIIRTLLSNHFDHIGRENLI